MPVTLIIIVATTLVSVWAFSNNDIYRRLAFNAYDIKHFRNGHRFLSYALVHADWIHLMINMLVLYSFGRAVESYYSMFWGTKGVFYYLLLYIGGTVMSTTPAYAKHKDDYTYTAVGASGAVSAVVFASIIFDPLNRIYLFMIPVGIPAVIFGVLYLAYSWYMAKRNIDNIGHDVHFWGAVFGFFFTIALKPALALYFFNTVKSLFG
ncbi:MAG TPA: rhomboid family intramembrane serine protease [Bacteroidales bacterium]|jgi:membrane associated rhomboid family serine protease|nr:rhomboid family intramembrane serine protease [Bacteroidales bacterium]